VPFENCVISDQNTFVAGLAFRLGLVRLPTGIGGHYASLLQ